MQKGLINRVNMTKVALGLSGGVDSAVSARLLLAQGYEVTGVYLECYREAGCRSDGDRQDALQVALDLGIPFVSLDMREIYRQKVLDYFYHSYEEGRTPNPDLLCNLEVKFGAFYDWAMKEGFEKVATGHYARIKDHKLYTAADKMKDQTYFLALVNGTKWERVIFPIGDLEKKEVRELARRDGLLVAEKADSTGVCFVGEVGLRDFLGLRVPLAEGLIWRRTKAGALEEIGTHKGAAFYTIGQRHGLTIKKMDTKTPQYFVIEKDVKKNWLIVGEKEECYKQKFLVREQTFFNGIKEKTVWIRVRHQGEILRGKISPAKPAGFFQVELEKKVFALASGQFAVFYQPDERSESNFYCLGGAEIE